MVLHLDEYQIKPRPKIPWHLVPGVYVLLGREGQVLYVGQATNLGHRLHQHLKSQLGADYRIWVAVEARDRRVRTLLEKRLIQKLRPAYNKMWRRRG